ncbi:MAG: glycosyltransferase family 4 protein [Planctomycetia bacterium]|nr:glycosyltransferase family 4 protein [Planctomycetia bacterium]
MKIVCFRHFEKASECHSPFCKTLDDLGVDYYVFWDGHQIHYRHRLWLYFIEWPRLLFLAFLRTCWYLFGKKKYDFVVAWTHLELLPTVLLKKFLFMKHPPVVLSGFIFTPRRSTLRHCIRYTYFRWLLNQLDFVIVHSRKEQKDYTQLFGFEDHQFVFVPFGTHVNILPKDENREPFIFSAGRSGRDYPLLMDAMEGLPYSLHVACDSFCPQKHPANVTVLDHCFNSDYLRELTDSELVVIPLEAENISAGQMVLIESMALGKTVIITRTETTEDYAIHNETAFLVERGDKKALQDAIRFFMEHPEERRRIGENARRVFNERFSMEAYTQHLHTLLETQREA